MFIIDKYKNNIHFSAIGKPYVTLKVQKDEISEVKQLLREL